MSEICILYCLQKREMTIYTVRKTISDLFGAFTKPSHGTIHPALKNLYKNGYVNKRDELSEGGKKSSFYSITDKGKKLFVELMNQDLSSNPSVFLNEIKIRYSSLNMLNRDNQEQVKQVCLRALEIYILENNRVLDDKYRGLDDFQREMIIFTNQKAIELMNVLKG